MIELNHEIDKTDMDNELSETDMAYWNLIKAMAKYISELWEEEFLDVIDNGDNPELDSFTNLIF